MLHIVLIAVISFSMTACEQATDPGTTVVTSGDSTVKNIPDSLPAFTLDAQVYTGGALLTWDLVVNASHYEVWRQARGKANVLLNDEVIDQTAYADVKSRLNDLQAGDYTYTVVAVSKASTKVGAAPVVIQSSKAVKAVTFTAGNLSETTLTPVTNLKLELTPFSNVLATWDADANPLVSYEVYNRQESTPEKEQTVYAPSYAFPLVGGTVADVIVRKVLFQANIEDDIQFYNPSADASASITVFNLSDATVSGSRDNNASVKLALSNIPSVTGLASFELSRYKYAVSSAETPSWTPVSLASARLTTSSDNINAYEVYDTLPANSENDTFVYRLMGKYPGVNNLRNVAYSDIILPVFNTMTLKPLNLTITPNTTFPTSPSTSIDDLDAYYFLVHDFETDADYTYYRKQVSGANGIALPADVRYDWEPLTIASVDKTTSMTSQTIKVTVPAARTIYKFKVIATGTGSKAGYRSVEADNNIDYQFRNPIKVPSHPNNRDITEYFSVTLGANIMSNLDPPDTSEDANLRGVRRSQDGTMTTGLVYSLNLVGLNNGLLREGESLTIEMISSKGAAPAETVTITGLSTSWIDNAPAPGNNPTNVLTANRYYFVVPVDRSIGGNASTTPLFTTIRLHVNAR
jgi:hypothetical protein